MTGRLTDPEDPRHGTFNGYGNLRCRCDRCREANRSAVAAARRRRGQRTWDEYVTSLPPRAHGTTAAYAAGCRCDDCRTAVRNYKRAWRARRVAS